MSREPTDVMIAAYMTREPARLDYEAVHDSGAKIEGAVCVTRDTSGHTTVEETDKLVRKGATALGGAGLVVGLIAPPLLLSTAIGAAIGGGLGKAAESKVKSEIEEKFAAMIPWGGAGVIVAYPRGSADTVEEAVTRALKKEVGEADGKKVDALKKALADAGEKMKSAS